jgi:hypothetical protein
MSFYQGENLLVELPLVKNGVNVNCSQTTGVKLKAKIFMGGQEVANYSTEDELGYGKITLVDEVIGGDSQPIKNNKFVIVINREQSKTFPVGVMRAAVEATVQNNTYLLDGVRKLVVEYPIGHVQKGWLLDVQVPYMV